MFTELHREEKREEGDRGGLEDKRGNQKEREIQPVISSLSVLHSLEHLERFTELHREEKREEGDRGGRVERGETNLASNEFPKYSPQPRTPREIHGVKKRREGEGRR